MTAKLVTNPDKKPVNAKILGSKTIESKVILFCSFDKEFDFVYVGYILSIILFLLCLLHSPHAPAPPPP